MCRIEPFVIFAVAPLYFPVVSGCIGPDQLMHDAILRETCLEQGGPVPMGSEAICELGAVICLDTFDGHGEGFDQMLQKQCGGIGVMLLKSLYKAPAGVFIAVYWKNCFPITALFLRQAKGTNLTSTWMRCPGYAICS